MYYVDVQWTYYAKSNLCNWNGSVISGELLKISNESSVKASTIPKNMERPKMSLVPKWSCYHHVWMKCSNPGC